MPGGAFPCNINPIDSAKKSLPWGKFASFLDEDGNKYGLKG
jgi:hypothetical protein